MDPLPLDDDARLMLRVAQGDERALLTLYDRYAPRVFGLALRILGERMAAEEVTQDTFLKAWTRARSYSPARGKVLSWLLTIARRTALDRLRLDKRRPDRDNPLDPEDLWRGLADPRSATEESRWRALHFALLDLPAEQRQVIALAYFYGMSQREIAGYLGLPIGTVKTRLRLGMEKLRRAWASSREEESDSSG